MAGVLAEGSRFGVYVVGACIGHGGMARIYRAEHEGLRRNVALKVLIDGFAQDAEGRERFLREARIAAAIKHPNVVNIFDVGVQDDVPYLVMELLEGEDLEAAVHRKGALSESTLVDVIVPVVAGLAAVHDAGVVHRDLKPGNIFLARGRNDEIEPKLLDFGISRAAESDQFKLTTARGLLMGTPLYMSPEAIQGGEITALSDQYSLGVVLYECSTGFNPFAADTLAETVRRVTTGDYPPISQYNPNLSRRMCRIIERAMSLDPAQRFTDLREMGRELLLLAGQRTRITWSLTFGEIIGRRTGSLAVVGATLPPASRRAPLPQQRRLGTMAAVGFGVLTFAAAIALLWSRQSPLESSVATHSLRDENRAAVEVAPQRVAERPRQEAYRAEPALANDTPPIAPPLVQQRESESTSGNARSERASDDVERARPTPSPRTSAPPEEREAATASQRRKRRPPAPPPRPRATAARATTASNEAAPEWLSPTASEDATPSRARNKSATSVGTNNAPIFE